MRFYLLAVLAVLSFLGFGCNLNYSIESLNLQDMNVTTRSSWGIQTGEEVVYCNDNDDFYIVRGATPRGIKFIKRSVDGHDLESAWFQTDVWGYSSCSPDLSKAVMVGEDYSSLILIDLASGEKSVLVSQEDLNAEMGTFVQPIWLNNQKILITMAFQGIFSAVVDCDSKKIEFNFNRKDVPEHFAVSADCKYLIYTQSDGRIMLYHIETGALHPVPEPSEEDLKVIFSKHLSVCSKEHHFHIYHTFADVMQEEDYHKLSVNDDEYHILMHDAIFSFDLKTGRMKTVQNLPCPFMTREWFRRARLASHQNGFLVVEFSLDAKRCYVYNRKLELLGIWDAQSNFDETDFIDGAVRRQRGTKFYHIVSYPFLRHTHYELDDMPYTAYNHITPYWCAGGKVVVASFRW